LRMPGRRNSRRTRENFRPNSAERLAQFWFISPKLQLATTCKSTRRCR
jgi:hypothetical protein